MANKKKKKPAAKKVENNSKVKAAPAGKEAVVINDEGRASAQKPALKKEKSTPADSKPDSKKRELEKKASEKKPKHKLKKKKLKNRLGLWFKNFRLRVKGRFSELNKKLQTKRLPRRAEKIAALVTLSAVVVAGIFFSINALQYKVPDIAVPIYAGRDEASINVSKINVSLEEQTQRAKAMRVRGDKKQFKFFASNKITINEWSDSIPLTIANVSSNKCVFLITILDKNDQVLYRSLGLQAGLYLPSVSLFNKMNYGEYKLKLVVSAYDPKTYKNIGVQYTNLKLVIGIEQTTEQAAKKQ